jgi:hypothetical protein
MCTTKTKIGARKSSSQSNDTEVKHVCTYYDFGYLSIDTALLQYKMYKKLGT